MKNSASETLYQRLKLLIQTDEISIGEKLPTEQSLCEIYGVGRSTVREAQRVLQAKGFVKIRRGSGAYVVSKREVGLDNEKQWLSNNKESIQDYMDVRVAIEVLAVRRLLARTEIPLEELEKIQERFAQAVEAENGELMADLDCAFHEAIAEYTQNTMLTAINGLVQKEFMTYRRITFEEPTTRRDAVTGHRKILAAMRVRDTDGAVFAIREHLNVSMRNAVSNLTE